MFYFFKEDRTGIHKKDAKSGITQHMQKPPHPTAAAAAGTGTLRVSDVVSRATETFFNHYWSIY